MGSVMWILIAIIIEKKQLSTYNNITELKLIVDFFFSMNGRIFVFTKHEIQTDSFKLVTILLYN